ncbi:molybdenum cofactor guanylyltransferase [Paenibacillus sp. strain BS8-2]
MSNTDTRDGQPPFCHGLILAGGQSSRMGQDKALLVIDGHTLLGRLIGAMRVALSGDIVIAVHSSEREALYRERLGTLPQGVRFVYDRIPEAGPLGGLAAGLASLPAGYAYVAACDSPELSPSWVARLLAEASAEQGVRVVAARGEPLHALYHTEAFGLAEEALALGDYRLRLLLRRLNAKELELGEREKAAYGLFNLNTPEQFESYLAGRNHKDPIKDI